MTPTFIRCDRCGEPTPSFMLGIIKLGYPWDTKDRDTLFICEQCYTTIKEVLQDGEIK